jgi:FAD:protein FMN transferase
LRFGSLILLLSVFFAFTVGCSLSPIEETRYLMGTQVSITVYDYDRDKLSSNQLGTVVDSAFREIARVENFAHRNNLRNMNNWAGTQPAFLGNELISLIDHAYSLSLDTYGTFRPDLGPLVSLWGVGTDSARIPLYWEIEDKLELISETIFTVEDTIMGRLDPFGASLDLGGVAKGYAVDRACLVLKDLGITAGMVWAGGDLKVFGRKPDHEPWRVAVRHPRDPEKFAAVLELYEDAAVATSGDYERYFEIDEGRYHHIIDPGTGYPAINSISATVVADLCTDADAYATAFFVLGPEAAIQLAATFDLPTMVMEERQGEIIELETSSFRRLRASDESAMVQ